MTKVLNDNNLGSIVNEPVRETKQNNLKNYNNFTS